MRPLFGRLMEYGVLDQSLSIVLPVHNSEAILETQIQELLEFLPELTSRFEVLILDDASTDQTEEVACDLALRFPQVRVQRLPLRRGYDAAVQAALRLTTGEIVFLQEEGCQIMPRDIRRLWKLRTDKELIVARSEVTTISNDLMTKLSAWGESLRHAAHRQPEPGGIQMIRREALAQPEDGGADYQVSHIPPPKVRQRSGDLALDE